MDYEHLVRNFDKKHFVQYGEREERSLNVLRILVIVLLITAFSYFSIGCSTYNEYKSIAPEQKAQFLKEKTTEWLKNNKMNIEDCLVLSGTKAMQYATFGGEQKEIANQMWAASLAFKSLATGEVITPEKIESTLKAFGAGSKSIRYKEYISDATVIWKGLFGQLKLSEDQQLLIDYLLTFSNAAERVASIYTAQLTVFPNDKCFFVGHGLTKIESDKTIKIVGIE